MTLVEIGPVVFRVTAAAEFLTALALEGQAGGVHEDDAELGKQVAPAGEQLFLDEIPGLRRGRLLRQRGASPPAPV